MTTPVPRCAGASPRSRPRHSVGAANARPMAAPIGSCRPSTSRDASTARGRRPARTRRIGAVQGTGGPDRTSPLGGWSRLRIVCQQLRARGSTRCCARASSVCSPERPHIMQISSDGWPNSDIRKVAIFRLHSDPGCRRLRQRLSRARGAQNRRVPGGSNVPVATKVAPIGHCIEPKTRCGRPLGGHTAGRWHYPVRGVGAPRSQSPKHQSKKYRLAYIAIMSRSCAKKGGNREFVSQ